MYEYMCVRVHVCVCVHVRAPCSAAPVKGPVLHNGAQLARVNLCSFKFSWSTASAGSPCESVAARVRECALCACACVSARLLARLCTVRVSAHACMSAMRSGSACSAVGAAQYSALARADLCGFKFSWSTASAGSPCESVAALVRMCMHASLHCDSQCVCVCMCACTHMRVCAHARAHPFQCTCAVVKQAPHSHGLS